MMRALIVLVLALVAGRATAEPSAKPRVAIVGDPAMVKAVGRSIDDKVELVEIRPRRLPPAKLAERHGLTVIALASGRFRATAIIHGADGAVIAEHEIKVARRDAPARMAQQLWNRVGAEILQANAPPVVAEPPPIAVVVDPAPETRARVPAVAVGSELRATAEVRMPRTPLVTVAVEERPFWRRLRFNDDLDGRLRPSDLVANAVAISAQLHPLPMLRGFSIDAHGERAVGVRGSRTSDGTSFGTRSSEWSVGAGYELSLGRLRAGLTAAYGRHRFTVKDEAMSMELVPDVAYRWFRGGATVDVPLSSRWELAFTGGWRQLLVIGELQSTAWFPRAEGNGIDASAGISMRARPWLRLYARVDMRRYFFTLNPEPGDPFIAGGATDQYFGGAIGAAISPR